MDELTFAELRKANAEREPMFPNAQGRHYAETGEWTLSDWAVAVGGETGELLNEVKKIRRGDFPLAEGRGRIANKAADIVIYLDTLCRVAGIDLGEAVRSKFNSKSRQLDLPIML